MSIKAGVIAGSVLVIGCAVSVLTASPNTPVVAPTTTAQAASWHPANWDTTLPPGVSPIRADGYRIVPDVTKTPGDIDPNVTQADLDTPSYIKESRNVTQAQKNWVLTEYVIPLDDIAALRHKLGTEPFEIDHDIPLCLGSTDATPNLWAEPFFGPYNAHDKDRLEVFLHRQVQALKLVQGGTWAQNLAEGQNEIRGFHWVWSWDHYFNNDNPLNENDPNR
jgi:hypothetical protein